MAHVIVTVQIMPSSPEVNLDHIKAIALPMIAKFGAQPAKEEVVPIAFGIKALKLFLIMDESKGGTDRLEADLGKIAGVESVNVIDVRRTLG